jgi:putative flippase GtrA
MSFSIRQLLSFAGVGFSAALVHYGLLISLVEIGHYGPVPATLAGYLAGGGVSYVLNRRHTFQSERPHEQAVWRFVLVAGVGFCLTYVLMALFVEVIHAPYLPAQVLTTGVVMFWSYIANRVWTFPLDS